MTNKDRVIKRYPNAYAVQSAQLDYRWVVMDRASHPSTRLGVGDTPQQAWHDAYVNLPPRTGAR